MLGRGNASFAMEVQQFSKGLVQGSPYRRWTHSVRGTRIESQRGDMPAFGGDSSA